MAKQDINLGTQPTGVGGDTNRSANIKTNANLKEIYTALGGSSSGGNGSVLPDALPVNKGGTGAASAGGARTNLGLGTAAVGTITTSTTDTTIGRVTKVGDFGLGATTTPNITKEQFNDPTQAPPSGFYSYRDGSEVNKKYRYSHVLVSRYGTGYGKPMMIGVQAFFAKPEIYFKTISTDSPVTEYEYSGFMYHTSNTTVDSNGFIKAASPIVKLYLDRIELNDEAKLQNITFEKLGIGDYLIKNSSGFAQEGWYVEQPKDANGNIYHAVVYDTLENGDISVKTYEQKLDGVKIVVDLDKPVDVKENRFISIRLQELPQPEFEEPQPDPTITDYQGNPAPSHLHELVDGTWTISSESAAILENERLAAMPALTRRQFRLALVLSGYNLADIETLINSIEDSMQRQITMIEWQDATTFHRTNPSLIVMAGLMGLGAETVDQLWLQASTL